MSSARQPPVDGLDFIGDLHPGAGLAAIAGGRTQAVAQRLVATEPLELRGQGEHVTEGKQQATLALADHLAVELEVGDDRDRAGGEGLPDQPRRGSHATRGEAGDVRAGQELGRLAVLRPHHPEPLAQAPADPGQRIGRTVEPDHALPVEVVGKPAQGAQQQTEGAALLLGAVHDPDAARRRWIQGRLGRIRPRADQLVLAGEEALQQLTGGLVARGALVDPPEEDLDQHPGDLSGEHSLDGLVEGGDVERLGMPERRRPRAGDERLVDVDQIERHSTEQPLQRAADVKRKRCRTPARPARQRDALADGEDPWVFPFEQSAGTLPGLAHQPAAVANRSPGLRWRDDQDPVATMSQLLRGPGDELVDLVPGAPRMRTDLRDRKGVGAHSRSIDTRTGPARARPLHSGAEGEGRSDLCGAAAAVAFDAGPVSRTYLAFALAFFAFLPLSGTPRSRAYLAMNSSVSCRAIESGRWLCGDFIR